MDLEAIIKEITQEVYSRLANEGEVKSSKALAPSDVIYAVMGIHTTLKDVEAACHNAVSKKIKTILLPQWFVSYAHDILGNADVNVATIVGLPGGTTSVFAKYAEAKQAVANGAKLVIIPMNTELLKKGDFEAAKADLSEAMTPMHNKAQVSALIDAAIPKDALVKAAETAVGCGVQFVLLANATDESVRALRVKNLPVGIYGGMDSFNQLGALCHVTSRI